MTFANGLFPWSPSWGEINYFAYKYPTIEFHDELYGFIQEKTKKHSEKEIDDYFSQCGIDKTKQWIREIKGNPQAPVNVTLPVFIRNKIHHRENNSMKLVNYTQDELKQSIEFLIKVITTKQDFIED